METRLIQFTEAVEGPEIQVSVGNYSRLFVREQQPFSVTLSEWEIVKSVRLFAIDAKAEEQARKVAEKEEEKAHKAADKSEKNQ